MNKIKEVLIISGIIIVVPMYLIALTLGFVIISMIDHFEDEIIE